jgi:hypothetical protein
MTDDDFRSFARAAARDGRTDPPRNDGLIGVEIIAGDHVSPYGTGLASKRAPSPRGTAVPVIGHRRPVLHSGALHFFRVYRCPLG